MESARNLEIYKFRIYEIGEFLIFEIYEIGEISKFVIYEIGEISKFGISEIGMKSENLEVRNFRNRDEIWKFRSSKFQKSGRNREI